MMTEWIVKSSGPFIGTEEKYLAYAKDSNKLLDWLYVNWFPEECQRIWDEYNYLIDYDFEEEFQKNSSDYDDDFDLFMDTEYDKWCEQCNLEVYKSDIPEEDKKYYEIIYNENEN